MCSVVVLVAVAMRNLDLIKSPAATPMRSCFDSMKAYSEHRKLTPAQAAADKAKAQARAAEGEQKSTPATAPVSAPARATAITPLSAPAAAAATVTAALSTTAPPTTTAEVRSPPAHHIAAASPPLAEEVLELVQEHEYVEDDSDAVDDQTSVEARSPTTAHACAETCCLLAPAHRR